MVTTKIYVHSSRDIGESEGIGMADSSECYKEKSISDLSYWYMDILLYVSILCHMDMHISVSKFFFIKTSKSHYIRVHLNDLILTQLFLQRHISKKSYFEVLGLQYIIQHIITRICERSVSMLLF